MHLSDDDRRELLRLARRSIEQVVLGHERTKPEPASEALQEPSGAFVTLSEEGQLRGCIGFTEAVRPLSEVVCEVAAKAAIDDPRFPPVSKGELDKIEVEVSVLSPLEKVSGIEGIEVGKHGILLEIGYFRGLLLPQVAIEHHWDRETFLENTARKAGLQPDAWKSRDSVIYTFTADVIRERDFGG